MNNFIKYGVLAQSKKTDEQLEYIYVVISSGIYAYSKKDGSLVFGNTEHGGGDAGFVHGDRLYVGSITGRPIRWFNRYTGVLIGQGDTDRSTTQQNSIWVGDYLYYIVGNFLFKRTLDDEAVGHCNVPDTQKYGMHLTKTTAYIPTSSWHSQLVNLEDMTLLTPTSSVGYTPIFNFVRDDHYFTMDATNEKRIDVFALSDLDTKLFSTVSFGVNVNNFFVDENYIYVVGNMTTCRWYSRVDGSLVGTTDIFVLNQNIHRIVVDENYIYLSGIVDVLKYYDKTTGEYVGEIELEASSPRVLITTPIDDAFLI